MADLPSSLPLQLVQADERYPIGPPVDNPGADRRPAQIASLRQLPENFAAAYQGLGASQVDTPYRDGGWTLRQLAHHLADSHMNAFTRVKLALTEDWPIIKPYDEKLWAITPEVRGPIEAPLALLAPLHARMADLFASLDSPDWDRGYLHPESGRTTTGQALALYDWHGRHHTAHVLQLRARRGW